MIEPLTTVGAGLAVLGAKDILTKLLGPTADYIGNEAKNLVDRCNVNLDNIFLIAKRKLGEKIEEPGGVNPRVLKHVIDDGRFCEDSVTAEYYGGILAASRSKDVKNDKGIPYISVVRDLSSYQLKLHYIFYYSLKHEKTCQNLSLAFEHIRRGLSMYIPMSGLIKSLGVKDMDEALYILAPSVHGLVKQGLIGDYYKFGDIALIKEDYPSAPEHGIILEPSAFGAELLAWAEGIDNCTAASFLSEDIKFGEPVIDICEGINLRTPVVKIESDKEN